jgi:hypothetical protein
MKKFIFLIIFGLMAYFLAGLPALLSAQQNPDNFVFLTNLPYISAPTGSDFGPYVNGIVKLTIGSAGVLAVIVIIIGGLQYMTTDAISGKQEGKEKIWRALLGLIMAMASWLILNTINPDLLETDVNIAPANLPDSAPGSGSPITSLTTYLCRPTMSECQAVQSYISGQGCTIVNSCSQYVNNPPPDPPGPGGVQGWSSGYYCFAYESPLGGCN